MTAVSSAALFSGAVSGVFYSDFNTLYLYYPNQTKYCKEKQWNGKSCFNRNTSFLFSCYLRCRCPFRSYQDFIFIRIVFTHRNRLFPFIFFVFYKIFSARGNAGERKGICTEDNLFISIIRWERIGKVSKYFYAVFDSTFRHTLICFKLFNLEFRPHILFYPINRPHRNLIFRL